MAIHLANDQQTVLNRIIEIAGIRPDTDDGVVYRTETARARTIRESDLYTGVRISMESQVAAANVKLALDINFGDPITPAPQLIDYPALLPDMTPVRIFGYPVHTVLAEKITTAVNLGAASTRVRDYLDIWTLTGIHDLDAAQTRAAIDATATHRRIPLRPLSHTVADLATARGQAYTSSCAASAPTHPPALRTSMPSSIRWWPSPTLFSGRGSARKTTGQPRHAPGSHRHAEFGTRTTGSCAGRCTD
jgi:hypothetical protein